MKSILRSALVVLAFATPVLAAPRPSDVERTDSAPVKEQKVTDRDEVSIRELQSRIAAIETELARVRTQVVVSEPETNSHPLWQ
ncbi:MAG TPA: hypothetical protein VLT82_07650 [Myxococcaceae bacterium]|nr:hypothetical protein [Myxococcaceae bacterium]